MKEDAKEKDSFWPGGQSEREMYVDALTRARERNHLYSANSRRYELLRDILEVVILDKDGPKYLKGVDLDKYLDERSWAAHPWGVRDKGESA